MRKFYALHTILFVFKNKNRSEKLILFIFIKYQDLSYYVPRSRGWLNSPWLEKRAIWRTSTNPHCQHSHPAKNHCRRFRSPYPPSAYSNTHSPNFLYLRNLAHFLDCCPKSRTAKRIPSSYNQLAP